MTNTSLSTRGVAFATLMAFFTTSCGGKGSTQQQQQPNPVTAASPLSDLAIVQQKDAPDGLDLRVSDGKQGPPPFDRTKLAPAKKLDPNDVQALLLRAKPLVQDPDDSKSFALRPSSQPAPRTGETIKGQFPPPPSSLLPPPASDAGKDLKVVRWMPEGNVALAPALSVTFSQPMVAVTSQSDASATTPVKLVPQPKGNWRWIGTRTILFDPEVRFPQATTYHVEIPAGTRSANHGELKSATRFTFETPPPTIVSSYPNQYRPQHVNAPMFLLFDQKIDAQAVLRKLVVTANGKPMTVRLMDAAEIDKSKDKQLIALVEAANKHDQEGRWLAFRATEDFPKDAAINVQIPAGTPSAEGPNTTKVAQSLAFRTYPPLRIVRAECGYDRQCPPGTPFVIELNNPLDPDKFAADQVAISPEIPGLHVVPSGSNVIVQGVTKARTAYKAVVSRNLVDEFGQTLGSDAVRSWNVTDAVPTFYGPQGMVVLDPAPPSPAAPPGGASPPRPAARRPTLDFFSTNYPQLRVKLYRVTPADLDAYGFYVQNVWNKDRPPRVPGTQVVDQLVKTTRGKNDLVETSVDLAPALTNGLGHAIAIVEPYPWTERYDPPRMISWVQSTRLAVDAAIDADHLNAFTTELDTGKPATGVELELRPFGIKGRSDDTGAATLALGTTVTKGTHYLVARRGGDVAFVAEQNGYWNAFGTWGKQARPTNLAWYVIDDRKMYKPGEEVALKGWLRTINLAKHGDIGAPGAGVATVNYKVFDARGNEIAKGTTAVNAVGGFDTKFTLPKTPNLGSAWIDLEATGKDPWASLDGRYRHGFQIEEFRRPEFDVSAHASQGPFIVRSLGGRPADEAGKDTGGGSTGDVTVDAKYYAGGPLPGAPVNWHVTANQTNFTPPNRDDYTFGAWQPWWGFSGRTGYDNDLDYDDEGGSYRRGGTGSRAPKAWNLTSKTDATGAHVLHLEFRSVKPALPMAVTANASVTDVNRQAWAASAALIVHPSQYYVGLKTKKSFVEQGRPFELDVIGVDLDGKAVPGAKIEVKAVRLDWEYKRGKYTTKEVDPQTCALTAAKDPSACSFATKQGGTYQVTATIVDGRGRPNLSTLTFWVAGGKQPAAREVQQEVVQLIPDKKEYTAGNTAELLMQAPFYPAEAVVSWRRSGIVKTERIAITGPTKVITVPITDAMVPNMFVQVDLVGMAARLDDNGDPDPKLPKRPAYAVGTINLPVPPKQRTLAVTVAPSAPKLGPGESAKLAMTVKDASGRPVANAEAAVLVVDEAVLSLTGYQFPNPIDVFYGPRGADARDYYLRSYVRLANPDRGVATTTATRQMRFRGGRGGGDGSRRESPDDYESSNAQAIDLAESVKQDGLDARQVGEDKQKAEKKPAPSDKPVGGEDTGGAHQAIAIRSNFNPLAAFSPSVVTDGQGRATVEVKLPDNLTRYRIVAVATAGDKQFGKGESAITARLPLMVRPSPPRFLNFGDTFQLPVVVQNQTDAAMTVRLAARTTNATLTDGAGREVTVPANDRVEVQFPAAAELAGTARFQVVGSAGSASDAAELALPVWTPATTEAFATYGVIDSGREGVIKQPVAVPGKVVTQFGGIEVTTASTNLQALTDAMLYLVRYPYECAEQRASRVMAIAALRDVLTAFKTKELPAPAAMEASVKADLERLSQMQNGDGGYAFWERGRPSEPYLTVYVTNALVHAKQKGFAVPQALLDKARPYLQAIETHYPWWYSKEVRWAISAYALYTRKAMGDLDIAKGQKLLGAAGGVTKVTMETNGWLLGLFAGNPGAAAERKAIVRHALNQVAETAGAANFTTSYGDGAYTLLASDRRVDAVMLESLIAEQTSGGAAPGSPREFSDLIPKLVTGLLAHRKAGRWLNTQENTFALVAMDQYFHAYEAATPDFVAKVWLGNDYAGDHAFKGRSTEYFAIPIAMKDVATHDRQDLTIQKAGTGRLYYRIGMTYAPASLKLEPADYGFVVERRYEGVDDPKDVVRQGDGSWKVKAGARVRVKLTMVNEHRRYHVALVDPMPAGFEPMNPALAVTGPIPSDPKEQKSRGAYWWWYGPWYEHQNLRDERVEAFASLLWEGVHTYEYVARATTPGNFVVPPPKAEEMYMPETFGRGGSDRVIVE